MHLLVRANKKTRPTNESHATAYKTALAAMVFIGPRTYAFEITATLKAWPTGTPRSSFWPAAMRAVVAACC